MAKLDYQWVAYSSLTIELLYEIMQLRQEVFVVEQECAYLDADGLDRNGFHLIGRSKGEGKVIAYLRVIEPVTSIDMPKIGRVVVKKSHRGMGLAREIMTEALDRTERLFPESQVKVSAQCYLEQFYESLGFVKTSEPYDEDGIEHVEMVRGGSQEKTEKPDDTTQEKPPGVSSCLNPVEISALANETCTHEEKEIYLEHLKICKDCYEKYTTLMMFNFKEKSEKDNGGVIYLFNYPINIYALGLGLAFVGLVFGYLFLNW